MTSEKSAALDTYISDNIHDFLTVFTISDIFAIIIDDDYFYEKTYLSLLANLNYRSNASQQFVVHLSFDYESKAYYNFLKIDNFHELCDLLNYLSTLNVKYNHQLENLIIDQTQLERYTNFKKIFPKFLILPSNRITDVSSYYYTGYGNKVMFLKKLNLYAEKTQTTNLIHTIQFNGIETIDILKPMIEAKYDLKSMNFVSFQIFKYIEQHTEYFIDLDMCSLLDKVYHFEIFEYIIQHYTSNINQVLGYYDINMCQNLFLNNADHNLHVLKYLINLGFELDKLDFSKLDLANYYKPFNLETLKWFNEFNLTQSNILTLYIYCIKCEFDDHIINLFWDKLDKIELTNFKANGTLEISTKQFENILNKITNPMDIFKLIDDSFPNFKIFNIKSLDHLYDHYLELHSLTTYYIIKYLIYQGLINSKTFKFDDVIQKNQPYRDLLTKYNITFPKVELSKITIFLMSNNMCKVNDYFEVYNNINEYFSEYFNDCNI